VSIAVPNRRGLILVVALLVLNIAVAFTNLWPTPFVRWNGALSVELALLVLALAIGRWRGWVPSPRALRWLTLFWILLVVGRYADVTVQNLFGRELNLFWDARHFTAVGAMLSAVANPSLVALAVLGAIAVPLALYFPLRWAMRTLSNGLDPLPARKVLTAVAVACLVLGTVQRQLGEEPIAELPQFTPLVTPVYAKQAARLIGEVSGLTAPAALPPAPPVESDFSRVKGADVFVIFVESYGATSWDRPEYVRGLVPARQRFAASIADTGRSVVSAYATSPTFGGSSWLAHVSLLSGTEVRDGDTNVRLMAQRDRNTFLTPFRRHGYKTVAVMPGLRTVWPEGQFYGFDTILGEKELEYHGPSFGWWDITDQYAIAKMDAVAVAQQPRPPVFVFFPTISTHTPFLPVPPYQPDWSRIFDHRPYDADVVQAAWDQPPDWLNLGPGYVKAMSYSYDSLGGYLRLRHDRDFVLIVLGDHQPPAVVSGEGSSWDVPVHVIASRPALLERLKAHGFRSGLEPAHPAVSTINGLMPILLDAFGDGAVD
jgi:hypothetical protein